MNSKASDKKTKKTGDAREERLKQALKANLARRKAQTRARGAEEAGKTESKG